MYGPISRYIFLISSGCLCCEHRPSEPVNAAPIYNPSQSSPWLKDRNRPPYYHCSVCRDNKLFFNLAESLIFMSQNSLVPF